MTGNFKEFKVENHTSDTWDEHNAMTSTAVCVSFLPKSKIFVFNAIALLVLQILTLRASGLHCPH